MMVKLQEFNFFYLSSEYYYVYYVYENFVLGSYLVKIDVFFWIFFEVGNCLVYEYCMCEKYIYVCEY